ncbi:cytosolic phospholipase A2 delta [Dromiciops gliroides]|uniref:cytosolic phospholipase A2 delta n=1 Tax=Dromiciops gliroides TaxID=33562 RepID=UPI001CC7CBD8|nr:cytosolic phospholipase A2 delta [Dromiciops gliroides]
MTNPDEVKEKFCEDPETLINVPKEDKLVNLANSGGEVSTCFQLSVKILEARNLPQTDLLSEADPYVVLQLPTASSATFKTKVVSNSNHPIWNETFSFRIQKQVKNILELKIYDADSVTEDDILFTVFFDTIEVSPGKPTRKTFSLNPQGQEELDVEFQIEEISNSQEKLITNNVLVARELSCLMVQVDKTGSTAAVTEEDELELTVKGSYEDTQISTLGSGMDDSFLFHYITAQEAEMRGCLKSLAVDGGSEGIPDENLTVPLNSLTMGEEVEVNVPAPDATALRLKLKANSCSEEGTVRLGFGLCDEEQVFLKKRKQVVAKALKRVLQLERELQEDEVPVIGVMAIGGGARAMTSLYGHLSALKKLDLLDCVTYISGTSGSTWTLSSLYEDPDWSQQDLEKPINHARENMTKSKLGAFSLGSMKGYQQELRRRAEEGRPPSFVDLWALVLEYLLHGKVTEHKLSEQRASLEKGQNPLPLYLGLNVKENNLGTLDFKEWVEFSPYEIGFLKYGAFIPSELFGSEFFMGQLMKKLPESRICFLEGLWSNIFSVNLMDTWYDLTSSAETWKQHIRNKTRNIEKEPPGSRSTSWINMSWLQPGAAVTQALQGLLTGRPLHHRCHNFLRGLHLHQDYSGQRNFCTWGDCHLDSDPSQLTPLQSQLCLVDAAYFINTSCPLLLRAGRSPDLIFSFGYSLNSPFEALEQMEIYCRGQGIPFPRVELSQEDRRQPRECHVFSDPDCPEAPTVLHFPLVNLSFREYSAPGVKRSPEELAGGQVDLTGFLSPYSLANMTYSGADFDRLLHLSAYNVQNSHSEILRALRAALKHCKRHQP